MCNKPVKNSSNCGPYALKDVTSNRQFVQDYAEAIGQYVEDFQYPKEIHKSPKLETLLKFAEKEFQRVFGVAPTHAVYAPAHVNLCGETTDFNDGKVLSMATQLVTVIVGTRRARSKRCKVKTLLKEPGEINYHEFCITKKGLDTSGEKTWVNYIKSVLRYFNVRREQIPGFKALIVSSIPIKCCLGSSSALTVAAYTFLESITNIYTLNILQKSLACQQAEKSASSIHCSIEDTLFSIAGAKGRVMEFDPRTLQLEQHEWKPFDVDLLLINSVENAIDSLVYQKHLNRCREVAFALNLTSLRDANLSKLLTVERIFSSTIIKQARHVIEETDRAVRAVESIKECRWKKLGMVMWESHYSMRDNFGSSCVKIEHIMGAIKNIQGIYGARIVGRGSGGLVLVLIRKEAVKDMVSALRSVTECREYQVIQPSFGASILYNEENE